jgi:cytochrome c5
MRGVIAISAALALLMAACAGDDSPTPDDAPAAPVAAAASASALDPLTGLKMVGDWEIVRANCTACHSAKLITQQRGDAGQWLIMIRWMQEKQNLWQFDPVTEEKIIAYLATNYPPRASQRRAALHPDLMPPNPYTKE